MLLDPLSANDRLFKTRLTPEEYKKSGVDKQANLAFMHKLAKMHMGILIKSMMKNAPPFHYYSGFTRNESCEILENLTKPAFYETAMQEYELAHAEENIAALRTAEGFPELPLTLITHSSELAVDETMHYGSASRETAEKIEELWQSIMKEYLAFTPISRFVQAQKSSHFIHLTQPELITEAIDWIIRQRKKP